MMMMKEQKEKCRGLLWRPAGALCVCGSRKYHRSEWGLYLWITRWRNSPPPPTRSHHTRSRMQNRTHNGVPIIFCNILGDGEPLLLDERGTDHTGVTARPPTPPPPPPHPQPIQTLWNASELLWFAYLELIKEGWCQLKMSATQRAGFYIYFRRNRLSSCSSAVLLISLCCISHILQSQKQTCYLAFTIISSSSNFSLSVRCRTQTISPTTNCSTETRTAFTWTPTFQYKPASDISLN